jgi:lipopolysaccharide transport system ATP-binding protein
MSAPQDNDKQPVISVRHVGVSYWLKQSTFRRRRFWALKDVSFDLYRGDSLGVIGKNGVGKSTLLLTLAGVMSPDCGTITNHGVSTSLLSLNLGFLPYLSGRENAILGGMFQGLTKRQVESKLDEIIAFAELEEFIDQPISTYSSGMKARLGFSVAFQVQPDVLLIDEVIGVGDAAFQQKSINVMKERIRSQDTTILFVSHSAPVIRDLCNRVVWIEDRHVRAEGETGEVLGLYQEYLDSLKK